MRGGEWDYVGIGERGSVLFFLGITGTKKYYTEAKKFLLSMIVKEEFLCQ